MKNLKKLLFAAALVGAAVVSAPKTASADLWCDRCDAHPSNCVACCMCGGGNTLSYCTQACNP
jgi:hypothetical protein